MSRRVNLPGAEELFRRTEPAPTPRQTRKATTPPAEEVGHTGRVRHDEKFTVYVSSGELLALEQARLSLRAEHGLAADRGRIVRAAIAQALADLAEHGESSQLVARLRER